MLLWQHNCCIIYVIIVTQIYARGRIQKGFNTMKKILSLVLAMVMCLSVFTACTSQGGEENTPPATATFRIAGMKGPTTMGMTKLMKDAQANNANAEYEGNIYNVEMFGTAQEINPLLIQGQLDAAAVPANVAATLYAKTEGALQVVAVNTLGVLYMVQIGDGVQSIADLKGKTIYTTGKGTTPEYTLRHILSENGIYEITYNTIVTANGTTPLTTALHLEINGDLIPAISYCIDRQAIVDAVLLGEGFVAYSPNQMN